MITDLSTTPTIYKSLFTENSVATQKHSSTSINTNKIQYKYNVFKRYHSDKHFAEFLPIKWRKKIKWHRYGTKLRHRHPVYEL